MIKRIINIIFFSVMASFSSGQTGGDNIYEFLNLTHSGFIASVGGANVSVIDRNLNMSYNNPSLLNKEMDRSVALNYTNYLAGINYGLAMYARTFKDKSNFAVGITYLNYGSFTEADPSGIITGTFGASEYAFSLVHSRELDSMFTVGIDFKPVISHLERYTSVGFALDLGGSWHSLNHQLSLGFVIKNIGYQLTTYAGEARKNPPFEVQAGVSARLIHAPLRFSLTLRHLEKFDLTWDYPGSQSDQTEGSKTSQFVENLMRHIIIGTEIIPHKNFYFGFGYNYQRRSELKVESGGAGTGFSWGFGINTSVICVEFGRARYHLAGASNHISLIVRPDLIYKRAQK